MNYDLLFVIIFYFILYSLFFIYRKKFDVQSKVFILYRTKIGLRLMERISKHKKILELLGFFSVVLGFIGMAFILYLLFKGVYSLFYVPSAAPVLAPVLPGIKIAGMPVLSFWHWIIAILIIATVHEFFHGVYARKIGVAIKSSGFAFLGPLLAAFVEPDEKQMAKKKKYPQLQVLSAGPFSNIIFAGIILIIMISVFNPISNSIIQEKGLVIVSIDNTMPINKSLLKPGMNIDNVDGKNISNKDDFLNAINSKKPGDKVFVKANGTFYEVELGNDTNGNTKMGVYVSPASIGLKASIKQKYFDFYPAYAWILELMFWLFAISLGVGLFNLLPLGPVDGGRMFYVGMLAIFKNEKKAKKIYLFITLLCLLLIFINLMPFIIDLFKWIISLVF